jgi:branched-chain amino acid transport system permease protein
MNIVIHLSIIICIFIILGVSLNLAVGYTGLLNLGHIAFYGMGAYISALLALQGWPFLGALFVAGVGSAVIGWLLTAITNRIKGDYLALATLGFAFIFNSVAINWRSVTRGPLGIPGIPKPLIFGFTFNTNVEYLVLTAVVTALVVVFAYLLTRSRYGKLLQAVRDDAIGLSALGKNVFRLKYQAMMVSAFMGGLAGSLYAHYITYIDPTAFFISDIIIILSIIIVGGLASLRGSVIAAVIIVLIPELLRFVDLPSNIVGPGRQIFYAVILLAILLWRPKGLFGKVELE